MGLGLLPRAKNFIPKGLPLKMSKQRTYGAILPSLPSYLANTMRRKIQAQKSHDAGRGSWNALSLLLIQV
jgi:hypothetical protein